MDLGWLCVERPDAELWCAVTDTDGPVVVLLHGLAGYALEWAATLYGLEGHCLVAVDLRGHGASTRRPTDVSRAAYVADVLAVLDALEVDDAVLVGHSFGAHTAMLVAAEAPDRVSRLLLLEGGLGGDPPEVTGGLERWLASWPVPFADRDAFLGFFGGQRLVAETWADGLEERADGWWPAWEPDVLAAAIAPVHARDWSPEWSRVRAPALLVRGAHSAVPERQVQEMLRLRPGTEVRTLPGRGHDLHLEAAEEWVALLRGWLPAATEGRA